MKKEPLAWAVWFCLAWLGVFWLADHENQPGASAMAPVRWPACSQLSLSHHRPLLLVFLHPRCPCSRACLNELNRLSSRYPGSYDLTVVIGLPGRLAARDAEEMLVSIRRIPQARTYLDTGLEECRRFGCYTSGQALLYSAQGRLRYQGGLTGWRAHEGENLSQQILADCLQTSAAGISSRPVYGCGLRRDEFCGR
ncbi:MAG: hypothetical protein U0931_24170 [Vulcanimicrobiota bacterium]